MNIKPLVALLAAAILFLGLSACGDINSNNNDDPPTSPPVPAVLEVLANAVIGDVVSGIRVLDQSACEIDDSPTPCSNIAVDIFNVSTNTRVAGDPNFGNGSERTFGGLNVGTYEVLVTATISNNGESASNTYSQTVTVEASNA